MSHTITDSRSAVDGLTEVGPSVSEDSGSNFQNSESNAGVGFGPLANWLWPDAYERIVPDRRGGAVGEATSNDLLEEGGLNDLLSSSLETSDLFGSPVGAEATGINEWVEALLENIEAPIENSP